MNVPDVRKMVCPACGSSGFVDDLAQFDVDPPPAWSWRFTCSDCPGTSDVEFFSEERP